MKEIIKEQEREHEQEQDIWEYPELVSEGPDGDYDLDYLIWIRATISRKQKEKELIWKTQTNTNTRGSALNVNSSPNGPTWT